MKYIQSKVTYNVPHWNFCNVDRFDIDGTLSKQVCQFCIKTKQGHMCALYNEALSVQNNKIAKVRACCKATAGFESVIEPKAEAPAGPTIPPKDLMKQTIELYEKTTKDLVAQGYPHAMAAAAAKKYILGG